MICKNGRGILGIRTDIQNVNVKDFLRQSLLPQGVFRVSLSEKYEGSAYLER